ncbi:MAG: transporter permease [Paenibacillaceae bacterium]|jgi:putative aldouronate transport system permease protein|nr:transporter permease [Paenibacillaceae bacterium]
MLKSNDWRESLFNWTNVIILVAISLTMIYPIFYVTVVSFTDPGEYIRTGGNIIIPRSWSLESYKTILSVRVFRSGMLNSTFLAVAGTVISLVITSMLAFAVSRKRFKGRKVILYLIMITMYFSPGMIPAFLVVKNLHLIDSIWSLIIPTVTSAWYTLLLKGFFDSIPESLEEAAIIDGCTEIGVWLRIILPLSKAAMAAFGLFFAVGYWNTFFSAVLYINKPELLPIQVILKNILISAEVSSEARSEMVIPGETVKMAAVVLATVPIIIVYPFLQKHFAKGAMVGSVKG